MLKDKIHLYLFCGAYTAKAFVSVHVCCFHISGFLSKPVFIWVIMECPLNLQPSSQVHTLKGHNQAWMAENGSQRFISTFISPLLSPPLPHHTEYWASLESGTIVPGEGIIVSVGGGDRKVLFPELPSQFFEYTSKFFFFKKMDKDAFLAIWNVKTSTFFSLSSSSVGLSSPFF